jgi:hypothetical protein
MNSPGSLPAALNPNRNILRRQPSPNRVEDDDRASLRGKISYLAPSTPPPPEIPPIVHHEGAIEVHKKQSLGIQKDMKIQTGKIEGHYLKCYKFADENDKPTITIDLTKAKIARTNPKKKKTDKETYIVHDTEKSSIYHVRK